MELGGKAKAYISAGQVSSVIHVVGPVFTEFSNPFHLMSACVAQVIREAESSRVVFRSNGWDDGSLAFLLRDMEGNLWKRASLLYRWLASTEFV